MTTDDQAIRAQKIAQLNDELRRGESRARIQMLMTPKVFNLEDDKQQELIKAVQEFDQFTPENDPYGEHDFGAITLGSEQYFFKIDYYDLTQSEASPDPTDPAVTTRVMTIMHASEY